MVPTSPPNTIPFKNCPPDLVCRPIGAIGAARGRKGARFNFPAMFLDETPSMLLLENTDRARNRALAHPDSRACALSPSLPPPPLLTSLDRGGCVGASDCVHIPWGKCPFADQSWYTGKVRDHACSRLWSVLRAIYSQAHARSDADRLRVQEGYPTVVYRY